MTIEDSLPPDVPSVFLETNPYYTVGVQRGINICRPIAIQINKSITLDPIAAQYIEIKAESQFR